MGAGASKNGGEAANFCEFKKKTIGRDNDRTWWWWWLLLEPLLLPLCLDLIGVELVPMIHLAHYARQQELRV